MEYQPGYKLENANYAKVLYYIDKMLAETDRYCDCARCRLEAAALALNTLPPHYHLKSSTDEEDKELGSPWVLIEMAAREGLEAVRESTRHKTGTSTLDEIRTVNTLVDVEPVGEDD